LRQIKYRTRGLNDKISVLMPVRKNSVHIDGFFSSYFENTSNLHDTELFVMADKEDIRNQSLFKSLRGKVRVVYEKWGYGKLGHHLYLNELYKYSVGGWMLDMCDDVIFVRRGWDDVCRKFIADNGLECQKIYKIAPGFIPAGAVTYMLSRGYVETVGRVAGYPNTDSWINTVMKYLEAMLSERGLSTRSYEIQEPMFQLVGTVTIRGTSLESGVTTPYGLWPNERLGRKNERLVQAMREEASVLFNAIVNEGK